MAHQVEPMDIDSVDSEFDNKENTFHHSNVLPCTEKGYEELDVSELNMKLRYSITPAASPMSKSYTNCTPNRNPDSDDSFNTINENNLTRSLNSTMTMNDNIIKSLKSLPLQLLPTDVDSNRNMSVLRPLDSTFTPVSDITVTVTGTNDIDENLSPSSSSSTIHTPEATTPTKDIPKTDGGSPIMRGLKSVLSMFRSSQSPIPPAEGVKITPKHEVLSPAEVISKSEDKDLRPETVVASTPIAAHRNKEANGSKRNSPYKDSIVFNDDLEKELQWKDETTILFSQEKIPIHKLFFQQAKSTPKKESQPTNDGQKYESDLNFTIECMDMSCNNSDVGDNTMTEQIEFNKSKLQVANESDSEFLDCETTFTKNESHVDDNNGLEINNIECHNAKNLTIEFTTNAHSQPPIVISQDVLNVPMAVESPNLPERSVCVNPEVSVQNIDDNISNNVTADSLDVTKYEDNLAIPEVHQKDTVILDESNETHVINSSIVNILSNLNNMESDNENLDIMKSIENITTASNLKDNEVPGSNANTAVAYECDFLEHNVSTTLDKEIININENNSASVALQSTIPVQIPELSQLPPEVVIEKSVIELPADVPLPDEDDFEKDHNIPSDDLKTTSKHIPPDLVDNIIIIKSQAVDRIPIELTNEINSTLAVVHDNNILPEITPPFKVSIEDDLAMKLEQNVENLSEVINDVENILACDEMSVTNNAQLIIKIKDLQAIDVNKSVKNLPALPDLINETISGSNQDCGENTNSPEFLEQTLSTTTSETEPNITTDISTNTEAVSIETCVLVQEMPQPECLDQTHHITNANIKLDTITVGLLNPPDHTTADEKVQEIDITKCLEQTLCVSNMQIEQTSEQINGVKNPEVDPVVEDKIALPEHLAQTQNICNADIGQYKAIDILTNIQAVPLPLTLGNNVENTNLPEKYSVISNHINKIIDENREITEVILTDEKVLKVTQESYIHNEAGAQTQSFDLMQDQQIENQANVLNNTIIMHDDKAQGQQVFCTGEVAILPGEVQTNVLNNTIIMHDDKSPGQVFCPGEVAILPGEVQTGIFSMQQEIKSEHQPSPGLGCNVNLDIHCSGDIKYSEIKKEDSKYKNMIEDLPSDANIPDHFKETPETGNIDKAVIVSENNSTYVSVAADLNIGSELEAVENLKYIENPFVTKTNVASSPPITSKGYNFNFDEMDDPFATKTQIRISPGHETHVKLIEPRRDDKKSEKPENEINKRRRKSQPERKKPNNNENKLNGTFERSASIPDSTPITIIVNLEGSAENETKANGTTNLQINSDNSETMKNQSDNMTLPSVMFDNQCNETNVTEIAVNGIKGVETKIHKETISIEENKSSAESVTAISNEIKNTSSSEQSNYYSADVSSNGSIKSRNVFNLPEIDDINFNPFATKSKVRQSPPPSLEVDDPFATRSKMIYSPDSSMVFVLNTDAENANKTINIEDTEITSIDKNCEDKMETEAMEKDSTFDMSNTTSSSKATNDIDETVREVHTEDEDTIEGPFLEAEDLNIVDKISDFDGENVDMMQFNDLPAPENEENAEGELFIDAEAFEFLLNQNKSNIVAESGKESLFLKFDPLFAKRMSSDTLVAALSKVQKRQSTPTKVSSLKHISTTPIAGPSTLNVTYGTDFNNTNEGAPEDLNITVSKPMMVVTPAVNPVATTRKSLTPTRPNRRSITFTSPAMAVIDRLLSLSANNSFAEYEATTTQVSREQHEADLALTQLREMLAEKEISVYNLRSESKELKDRLSTLESQMNNLETKGQERLKKINELNERLSEKTKINKSMAAVVEEYERTIASLIAETEQDKKRHAEERIALINERDEQTAHLASMEVAFNDLHSKYEKSKQVIMSYKANEEKYKKSLEDFNKNVTKMQNNYELLKQHATSKLNHANDELQKMNKAHEAEILKMNAMIKRKELHITSLEETLTQKTKANEELTAICDELINKVG